MGSWISHVVGAAVVGKGGEGMVVDPWGITFCRQWATKS